VADVVADSLAGQSQVLSITHHRTVDVPSGSDLVVADVSDAAVNDIVAALGRIDADVDLEVGITYVATSGRFRYVEKRANLVRPNGTLREISPYAASLAIPQLDNVGIRYTLMMASAAVIAAAGLLAGLDFAIVGAMAVSPDLGRMNAITFSIVSLRPRMSIRATLSLAYGLAVAALASLTFTWLMTRTSIDEPMAAIPRALVDYVTVVDALTISIAAAAGVAAAVVFIADHGHASAGVDVSITTIPAASFIGVAAGDGNWSAAGDAAVVLVVNVACVVVAGLATELVFRSRIPHGN
jgi:hypothetical protein